MAHTVVQRGDKCVESCHAVRCVQSGVTGSVRLYRTAERSCDEAGEGGGLLAGCSHVTGGGRADVAVLDDVTDVYCTWTAVYCT